MIENFKTKKRQSFPFCFKKKLSLFVNDSDPLISEKSLPYYFIFPCDFRNLKTFPTACFSILLVEESLLIINQSHELYIFIGVVLQAVELAYLNDAAVARANFGDGLVIIDEVCLTF